MTGLVILVLCLLRSAQLAYQSNIKISRYFWLAAVLVFLAVIRRELNFLPDVLVPKSLLWHGHSYDRWEDGVLTVVYLLILGLLAYSWRYVVSVLKSTPLTLYLAVALLAILQYMGENHFLIPEAIGLMVEEVCEDIIYAIALIYLWRFDLITFNQNFNRRQTEPYLAQH